MERTTVQERDFLDQDPPIRGQKYACVSFVSPEGIIAKKDIFLMGKFLDYIATDVKGMLDNLEAKYSSIDDRQTIRMVRERHEYLWGDKELHSAYNQFMTDANGKHDEEFDATNGFQTSVRGFKIRGVYDSIEESKERAKAIKRYDDKFDVYVAEVGCWCPWCPNPQDIKDQEYAETELNMLMKCYRENQELRDKEYAERKTTKLSEIELERDEWLKQRQQETSVTVDDAGPSGS